MRNTPSLSNRSDVTTVLRTLERDWTYRPSAPSARARLSRLVRGFRRAPAPPSRALVPITPAPLWIAYFLYLPDGRLTASHRYTIARLREERGAKVLLIAATPAPDGGSVLDELGRAADALYWKGLSGFDFSAFALALDEVAAHSSGSELILLNDSVFGPFASLSALFATMPWTVAGLTGNAVYESHVQSYCWRIRSVQRQLVSDLGDVMSRDWAYDRFGDVVLLQETRLAARAARVTSVGAKWYIPLTSRSADLPRIAPLEMLDLGLPLMKKSVLGKYGHLHRSADLMSVLRRFDHPNPGVDA